MGSNKVPKVDRSRRQMKMTPRGQRLQSIAGGIAICNFLLFGAISLAIGGDALSGKIENGIYFLGQKRAYTAVSAAVYYYSLVHLFSVFVTFLAMFFMVLYLIHTRDIEL